MHKFFTELTMVEGLNKTDFNNSGFKFIKEFEILKIEGNSEFIFNPCQHETGLLILEGTCEVEIEGFGIFTLGTRDSVFSGSPEAAYVPIDTNYIIRGNNSQICICRAECSEKTTPAVIKSEQVKTMQVGKDNWSRDVRIIIGPDSPSVNLIVGETLNPPGNWSGTPPHKHEVNQLPKESLHEELYYFKADKPQGWGIERLYSPEKGVNEFINLKENVVTFMPWGYHQIVAAPGYTLYYMFFLAGQGKELAGLVDKDHSWIL